MDNFARTALWACMYVAFISAIVAGTFYGRRQALATYGGAAAQVEWDAWREDAQRLADESGPVKRRAPKSAEPPALVLMRDHFAVCLGLAVVLSTVLFGTLMLFIRGALTSRRVPEQREMHSTNDGR